MKHRPGDSGCRVPSPHNDGSAHHRWLVATLVVTILAIVVLVVMLRVSGALDDQVALASIDGDRLAGEPSCHLVSSPPAGGAVALAR